MLASDWERSSQQRIRPYVHMSIAGAVAGGHILITATYQQYITLVAGIIGELVEQGIEYQAGDRNDKATGERAVIFVLETGGSLRVRVYEPEPLIAVVAAAILKT